MPDDEEKLRQRALELLLEQRKLQDQLLSDTQHVVGMTRSGIDNAELGRDLLLHANLSKEELQRIVDAAEKQNDALRVTANQMREGRFILATSTNVSSFTVSAAVTGTYAISGGVYAVGFRPGVDPQVMRQVLTRFNVVARGQQLVPALRAHYLRLGLDRGRKPHRAPLDLLNASELGFERPAGSNRTPNESLGPLRHCLGRTVLELYDRCKQNDSAGSWEDKVLCIARRAGRAGLPNGYFERAAAAVGPKREDLTVEKSHALTDEQLTGLYHETLMLLRTIVEGVDEQRLRPG